MHSVTFDTNQTSFTYLGTSQIIVSDDKGRLSIFNGIDKAEGVEMRLVKTNYIRLKSLNASPDFSFITAVSSTSIVFWSAEELKAAFDEDAGSADLMLRLDPTSEVPQSQRVLCSSVTVIQEPLIVKTAVKNNKKKVATQDKKKWGKGAKALDKSKKIKKN